MRLLVSYMLLDPGLDALLVMTNIIHANSSTTPPHHLDSSMNIIHADNVMKAHKGSAVIKE